MDFKTSIDIFKKTYKMLKYLKLESFIPFDNIIDERCPEIISRLQTYSNCAKIGIYATNGKKTTLSLINEILRANNNSFITNLIDNELNCVIPSLILNLSDNLDKKDYYTFALNTEELIKSSNYTKYDYLLLNNIFLNQTDDLTLKQKRQKVIEAINLNPKSALIINADDPMFNEIDIDPNRKKFYFGFDKVEFALGKYDYSCSFKRPPLDLRAEAKIYNDYSYLNIFYKENKFVFKVPLGGLYNAYNALGAIALAINLNIERKVIIEALENYSPIRFRDEIITYKDKKIKLKIIKNSASLSESIRELYGAKRTKVVFCLDDKKADGIDTSWVFGANFEALKGFSNKIYLTGSRSDDMALKLKYSDVNPSFMVIDSKLKSAINCCYWDLEEDENMLILLSPSNEKSVLKIICNNHR